MKMAAMSQASARLRVGQLLSTADLEPACVPPAAIFIVRTMRDPAPRQLLTDAAAHVAPPPWLGAARRRLDDLYRSAARPAGGAAFDSADAVVFHDRAELLACLARDFINGRLSGCWWWRAWLRATVSSLDEVVAAWLREARHIPAAVYTLQRAGAAVTLARTLSTAHAQILVAAMAEAYEAPALAAAAFGALEPSSSGDVGVPVTGRESPPAARLESSGDLQSEIDGAPIRPPWTAWAPTIAMTLQTNVARQAFLGVALTLWHAPSVARSGAFAGALRAWRRRIAREGGAAATATDVRPVRDDLPPAEMTATDKAHEIQEAIAAASSGSAVPDAIIVPPSRALPSVSPTAAAADRDLAAAEARLVIESPPPVTQTSALRSDGYPPSKVERWDGSPASSKNHYIADLQNLRDDSPAIDNADVRISVEPARAPSDGFVFPIVEPNEVRTELGGVLFLINALQSLHLFDLLEGFERPSATGWAFVEAVARALLVADGADLPRDPLWDVLELLEGEHRQAGIERSAMSGIVDRVLPALRERLSGALTGAAADPADERRSLAAHLLHRRGRLMWTTTHVDLHMSLDDVDIAVRLAGLDVNPSWVPALGRVITFYFD
jgi:hypothetical protein